MEDLKNKLKGFAILLVGYIVLFLTYFVENENLHNITYTIIWIWVVMLGIGVFVQNKKETKNKTNNKVLVAFLRVVLLGQPFVAIYFGDMWLGVLWLIITIMLILGAIIKKDGLSKELK